MFLAQLTAELRRGLAQNEESSRRISATAARHGRDLLMQGFTPSQVVHDYGDVCQAITELAIEKRAPIGSDDFRMLNRCLDDAIASAITEYARQVDLSYSRLSADHANRIRVLGDALRATLAGARAAFQAIKEGQVGFAGSTGMVLARSLQGAEDLNERLQSELVKVRQVR